MRKGKVANSKWELTKTKVGIVARFFVKDGKKKSCGLRALLLVYELNPEKRQKSGWWIAKEFGGEHGANRYDLVRETPTHPSHWISEEALKILGIEQ